VAFGFKSGIGSASRVIGAGERDYTVGALTVLNLGRPEALAIKGAPRRDAGGSAHPQGSALIVLATDAPFEDRQCRQIASAGLMGRAARRGARRQRYADRYRRLHGHPPQPQRPREAGA
jgi:D-aminopeptidase